MNLFDKLGWLKRLNAFSNAFSASQKEGTLNANLKWLGHALVLILPAVGGYAADQLGHYIQASHTGNQLLVAISTILLAIPALVRNANPPEPPAA